MFKRLSQVELLTQRCTFYERHEVLDGRGRVVNRWSQGSPFVHRAELGMVPVDPEDPFLDDGTSVTQETLGYKDADGNWHRVVRYRRMPSHPESTPRPTSRRGRVSVADRLREKQARVAQLLQRYKGDPVPLAIRIKDLEALPRMPSRVITGLAFTEHGRLDRITPLRRRIRKTYQERRTLWALPVRAWLRSMGAKVLYQATLHANVVYADVPRRHLAALAARGDVERMERRPTKAVQDETLDDTYLCDGLPVRTDRKKDVFACVKDALTPPTAYLDGVNAATGVLDYINAGYDGMIAGGNAGWAYFDDGQTLALGVNEESVHVNHLAFSLRGRSRFSYLFDNVRDETVVTRSWDEYSSLSKPSDTHGTSTAAIALASVMDGQDPELSSTEERAARSGIARMAAGLASVDPVTVVQMLETIGGDFATDRDGAACGGIDVIYNSETENSGEETPGCDGVECATDDEARGIDDISQAIVTGFFSESIIYVKSAGNIGSCSAMSCSVPSEVGAPGASPAAISVGAQTVAEHSPYAMQHLQSVRPSSSGEHTLDGRSYPSMVVPSYQCGCASTAEEELSAWKSTTLYGPMGATSGAAPRVAGSAILLKHWYLDQHGSLGMSAGRNMVNLLNFADGFVRQSRASASARTLPPGPHWGLGRFRLRLLTQDNFTPRGMFNTVSCLLKEGDAQVFDLANPDLRVGFPKDISRLRITAWWLDVNTGEGESKAEIYMGLFARPTADGPLVVDYVVTSTEHTLRLQYDRFDNTFPCPPAGGTARLALWAKRVSADEREPHRASYRTVYVTWFWETGRDRSEIVCPSSTSTDYCGGTSGPGPGDGPGGGPDGGVALPALRAALTRRIPLLTGHVYNKSTLSGTSPLGVTKEAR